jgi:xanthine dehydrogenase accessory factor
MPDNDLIIIRGGGDLATGVIQKFFRAGFRMLVLEAARPTAIRRTVALCEAVYDGASTVEDVRCRLIESDEQIAACHREGTVPLAVDPTGKRIARLPADAVIDAILGKRNLGTHRGMAPVTVGLGPGFTAGRDVDAVIETMRGHDLGRLILRGTAFPNTGVPGEIGGQSLLRVIHAPCAGPVRPFRQIGEVARQGEPLLAVGQQNVPAPFTGLVRGMIRPGLEVPQGAKIADVDPRTDVDTTTISDKARSLGGAALEAYLYLKRRPCYEK